MTRKGFLFMTSYYDSIKELDEKNQLELFHAICSYGCDGKELELTGIAKIIFGLIKPTLAASIKRYDNCVENGKRGGRSAANNQQNNPAETNNETNNETQSEPTTKATPNLNKEKEKEMAKEKERDMEKEREREKETFGETSSPDSPPSAEENFSEETTLTNCPDPSDKAEKYSAEINEIVAYLNEKTQSHYRTSTANTRRHIVARLKQCYTVDDFKHVIDVKCAEWLNDPKMAQYLRPETLFTERNFENYLQQKMPEAKTAARAGQPNTHYKQANLADIDYSEAY